MTIDIDPSDADDRQRLETLRRLVDEGIADIEAGRYITLHSDEEIDAYMRKVRDEVLAKLNRD